MPRTRSRDANAVLEVSLKPCGHARRGPIREVNESHSYAALEEGMKPTPEQSQRMQFWLELRVDTILKRKYSPVLGATLQADIESGMDFSGCYSKFGFTADGQRLLPDFRQINGRRS